MITQHDLRRGKTVELGRILSVQLESSGEATLTLGFGFTVTINRVDMDKIVDALAEVKAIEIAANKILTADKQ
jgi:hypothetical protein